MKAYIGIFIFLVSLASNAQVLRFRPGQFSLFTQLELYNTSANFDPAGGTFTKLDTGHSYSNNQVDFKLQYDHDYNWASYGGFTFSMAKSNDAIDTRSTANITKFTGGLQYKALKSPFLIVPQIQFVLPFENVNTDRQTALASDGALEFEAGAWVQKKIWKLYTYSYLGFDFRDQGLSSLMKYKFGTYTRLSSFYVGGEVNGFNSITNDKNTNSTYQRTVITDHVNGGSLKYNSVNPELLEVDAWGGFIFRNNYLFKVGYRQDINGANYAKGSTIYLGIDIRNFYLKSKEERRKTKDNRRLKEYNHQFQPEEDTMDDDDLDTDDLEKELELQLENKFDRSNKNKVLRKYKD